MVLIATGAARGSLAPGMAASASNGLAAAWPAWAFRRRTAVSEAGSGELDIQLKARRPLCSRRLSSPDHPWYRTEGCLEPSGPAGRVDHARDPPWPWQRVVLKPAPSGSDRLHGGLVGGWFGACRGADSSRLRCARLAERNRVPPSRQPDRRGIGWLGPAALIWVAAGPHWGANARYCRG